MFDNDNDEDLGAPLCWSYPKRYNMLAIWVDDRETVIPIFTYPIPERGYGEWDVDFGSRYVPWTSSGDIQG